MSETNFTVHPRDGRVVEGPSLVPDIADAIGLTEPAGDEQGARSTVSPPEAARSQLTQSAAWPGVALQVCCDLSEIEQEWKAFEPQAECTVFQVFDWVAKVQRHIGARHGTIPAVVLGREADGHLLFILPLAIEPRGLVRCLTWLGSVLCDYNAPLLAESFGHRMRSHRFAPLWRDIIQMLRTDPRLRFDVVDLQKMPEMLGAQSNPFLDLQVQANPSGAYVANLDGTWDEFYAAKRSSSTRKRERRQLKHLAEYGDVRLVDVEDYDDVECTLDTMFTQKAGSFARMGVEDIFARPGYRDFFRDIATDPAMREVIHVSRLDVGSTTAAANLGLRFRACYYLVLSSYQAGELSRLGPGRAHLHELLRHAIERGFHKFDFTIGDEPYKRDWSDAELKLLDHLAAVTMPGWLVVAMTRAFRRVKRLIKQTPFLWQAFSKARVLKGSIGHR
jgi:CelD/BcsL family acetyltransferase involved in cellulose biosynthesis